MKEQLVYQSKHQTVAIDEEKGIFFHIWNKSSEQITEEQYKEEIIALGLAAGRHQIPPKGLINLTNFLFVISPEMQEWHNKNIFQPEGGYTHMAIVATPDFITSLSVEQTFEDGAEVDLDFETRFFSQEAEALDWLCSQ